jgi:hypothetical protein
MACTKSLAVRNGLRVRGDHDARHMLQKHAMGWLISITLTHFLMLSSITGLRSHMKPCNITTACAPLGAPSRSTGTGLARLASCVISLSNAPHRFSSVLVCPTSAQFPLDTSGSGVRERLWCFEVQKHVFTKTVFGRTVSRAQDRTAKSVRELSLGILTFHGRIHTCNKR